MKGRPPAPKTESIGLEHSDADRAVVDEDPILPPSSSSSLSKQTGVEGKALKDLPVNQR